MRNGEGVLASVLTTKQTQGLSKMLWRGLKPQDFASEACERQSYFVIEYEEGVDLMAWRMVVVRVDS